MDDFIFSLQALATSIRLSTIAILKHSMAWGFGLGFLAATLLYMVIVSENPRTIPTMITRDARDSFIALASRKENGTFSTSYLAFQREYLQIRLIFYTMILAFLIVVAIALLRY